MVRDRHNFTLSNAQVEDIRNRPLTITMCRDLAKEFGVTPSQIKSILQGDSYAWLPGARDIPPQFTGYKLTPDEVVYIAQRMENHKYGDQKKLAERFGVTRLTIANIKYRRRLYTDTI
jgi:transcriptional regulator with XRE-family HTH domain